MTEIKRFFIIFLLCAAIILSCTVLGNKTTDPATYSHTISVLDDSRTSVLSLSAASAAASAAVSALPGDVCSPLADELSEFSSWFLIILTIVYLEKYLLTIFGFVSCYILVPAGCSSFLIHAFFPSDFLRQLGFKLIALGAALLLVVPTGVWISDQINSIYSESIQLTVDAANSASESLLEDTADDNGEKTTVIDKAAGIIENLTGSVANITVQFKNVLNRFIEATAVMVVTNCLIPILVILFYGWLIKTLFGIQLSVSPRLAGPMRKHTHAEREYLPEKQR